MRSVYLRLVGKKDFRRDDGAEEVLWIATHTLPAIIVPVIRLRPAESDLTPIPEWAWLSSSDCNDRENRTAAPHPVDAERSLKMIDFVLQDAGIPAFPLNAYRRTSSFRHSATTRRDRGTMAVNPGTARCAFTGTAIQ